MQVNFCIHCGAPYEEQQKSEFAHTHEIRCICCKQAFYENPKPVVLGYMTNERNEVLLTKRCIEPFRGFWSLPGGFMSFGESPEVAIRRELLEELSIIANIGPVLTAYHEFYDDEGAAVRRISTTVLVFAVTNHIGAMQPDDDISEWQWFAAETLPDNVAFENQRALLTELSLRNSGVR